MKDLGPDAVMQGNCMLDSTGDKLLLTRGAATPAIERSDP
jgi:hypothetical protein